MRQLVPIHVHTYVFAYVFVNIVDAVLVVAAVVLVS